MIDLVFMAMFQNIAGPPLPNAANQVAPGSQVAAAAALEPERVVVCRSVQTTGSRMPARRCASAYTDELTDEVGDELMRQLLNGNRTANPQSGFYNPGSGKRGGTGPGSGSQ